MRQHSPNWPSRWFEGASLDPSGSIKKHLSMFWTFERCMQYTDVIRFKGGNDVIGRSLAVLMVAVVLLVGLFPSLPVYACDHFTLGPQWDWTTTSLSEKTDTVRWYARTACLDSTLDPSFMTLYVEASITLNHVQKEYLEQDKIIGSDRIVHSNNLPKQDGTWRILGWHNGEYECFCGWYPDSCTTDDTLVISGSSATTMSVTELAEMDRMLAEEYRQAVDLPQNCTYYPLYERIALRKWGSLLDQAVMRYVMPSGGYYEIGDTMPMVYVSEDDDTVKVVIGKAAGDHLILSLEYDADDTQLQVVAENVR